MLTFVKGAPDFLDMPGYLRRAMRRPTADCRTGLPRTATPAASRAATGSPMRRQAGRSSKEARAKELHVLLALGQPGLLQ